MNRPAPTQRVIWAARVSAEALRLRQMGFGRACAPLMREPDGCPSQSSSAGQVAAAVAAVTATGRLPWSTCLTRSSALARHLRRRGIPAVLKIGVDLPEASFAAHAWVEINGQPVNEPTSAHARFKAIGTP